MKRLRAWWDGLSHQARFRYYTRLTLQLTILVVATTLAVSDPQERAPEVLVPALAVSTIAALLALDAQPRLATHERPNLSRRWLWATALTQGAVWLMALLLSATSGEPDVIRSADVVAVMGAALLVATVLALGERPRLTTLTLAVLTGLAIGSGPRGQLSAIAMLAVLGLLNLGMMHLTVWAMDQMAELERTKDVAARLEIAEQRLAFSRDLHDVVGRGFSAIAVKSELASTLARAGAPERAADEIDEVKALAVSSMEEMRALVRGYRVPDLATEIAGSQSLLSAAGCRLEVQGDPGTLDPSRHELAAWAVREGTTNIVKHSRASSAVLAIGTTHMSLVNNGVTAPAGPVSGLDGLRERLRRAGSELSTTHDLGAGTFTLRIRWEDT